MPTIYVYSKYLTRVENSGDSLVKVLNVVKGPKFSAKLVGNGRLVVNGVEATDVNIDLLTGNGTIVVTGGCENLGIKLIGAGVIQADELKADSVSIKAGGTGSVGVNALNTLKINGAATTKVYYKGEPQIKNNALWVKTFPL